MPSEVGLIRVKPKPVPPPDGGGGGPPVTPDKFVAVGLYPSGAYIQSSNNGTSWTSRSSDFDTTTTYATSVVYGNGKWVVGGQKMSGSDPMILTSDVGDIWTPRTSDFDGGAFGSLFYGGGKWIGNGYASSVLKRATSSDGISWSSYAAPQQSSFGWDGSQYVAVCGFGTLAQTSPDGVTWTNRTSVLDGGYCVVRGGSIWVAGGYNGSDQTIMTSPDGITWTARSTPLDVPGTIGSPRINAVDWNGSMFVAVGADGERSKTIITSPDGITWTYRASPLDSDFDNSIDNYDGQAVAWSASLGLWMATTLYGVLATSPDGITWTQRTHNLLYVLDLAASS